MGLFDDVLKDNESLFQDEISLDYDFLPQNLPFRENQHHYIAEVIKPLFHKRSGKNLFITGGPGIGKTAAVKFVLRELENTTDDIHPIYVNCWKKDTSYKIIMDICEQLKYKWTHNKRTDELMKTIAEIINRKSAVIVLDEVDKVKEVDILYQLAEDLARKCLVLIANDKNWISELDQRVKSRLNLEILEFKEYDYKETKGIMKMRRDYAYVPNVWNEDCFELVVEKTYDARDIRAGLFLLKECGNVAESYASKKITIDHVKKAINKVETFKIKKVEDFGKEEQEILELIKNNSGKSIKDLFDFYSKVGGTCSYRTFHRKLEELKDNKMIDFDGKDGKSITVSYSRKLSEF